MIHILLQGQEKTDKINCYVTSSVQNNDSDFSPRVKNMKIKVDFWKST